MDQPFELLPEPFQINPSLPIYEQFVEAIQGRIVSGQIPSGSRLPSVRELAAGRGVNPTTIARTYQELERIGLIVTYRGQGTFVTRDETAIGGARKVMMRRAIQDFKAAAAKLGITAEQLLEFDKEDSNE
ncbi:GntR family transcriptional regulator [Paenibacillus camerounensis]|uniref:GntR family transcriptional regulator n=1 Tax=Paenibacillus camerounensis TaxID=1243663 RepID=UPI0005A9021C|nr:GntR family transcriptional regulator [Paenibacillus camerounensis]